MRYLVTEAQESEASKQAKLKGYTSIGFGRWTDKFGNMVAFTTKTGRLAPYEPPEKPEPKQAHPAPPEQEPTSSITKPFIKPNIATGIHTSDASVPTPEPIEDPTTQGELHNNYDYYASKFAAEALLLILKWINEGKLSGYEFNFYTSKLYGEYALIMKDAVISLNTALRDLESYMSDTINNQDGKVTLNLKTIHRVSTLSPELLHIMLIDITKHGPSFHYAEAMLLNYAKIADQYDRKARLLKFNYTTVEHDVDDDDPTDPEGHVSQE